MTTNAARQANFDAFAPTPSAPRPGGDPLAELARIVGQDDPFRALLAARDARVEARETAPLDFAPPRDGTLDLRGGLDADADLRAPDVRTPHLRAPEPQIAAPRADVRASEPSPADAFDRYLAEVERGSLPADPYAEEVVPAGPVAPPRARRRLVTVGAALGVVVVAVAGGLTWRNLRAHPVGADGAPMVMADKAPLKVAPQNAGGADIPDQNRQIYERGAKDGQTRVVNREEQPVDVAQAARAAAPGAAASALSDSLGEPRRVRTVSVRPDATEARQAAAAPTPATATPSVIPTMTMPGSAPREAARALKPAPVPASTPASTPAAVPDPVTTAAAPRTTPVRPQRVASASPEAALPAETQPAPASGGFAVQLAVRPSEKEARVAFKQIQDRYGSDLGGRSPIIRQADVNGKTIYRIRVGASTLEDANTLCGKLKTSGGQCFVAKN